MLGPVSGLGDASVEQQLAAHEARLAALERQQRVLLLEAGPLAAVGAQCPLQLEGPPAPSDGVHGGVLLLEFTSA